MAPLPHPPTRRWLSGESVRAGLAVVAALAGLALLLHALLASDPTSLRLLPEPWQGSPGGAPLAAPLNPPLAGADAVAL
jgi:hypothetical protein